MKTKKRSKKTKKLKPVPDYTYRTKEFNFRIYTNSQGFRTDARREAIPLEKDPGVYRVMFLGPSFIMGRASDYEDTYVALIGERLKVLGKRVEVLNVGTPAQSHPAALLAGERRLPIPARLGGRYDRGVDRGRCRGGNVVFILGVAVLRTRRTLIRLSPSRDKGKG